MWIHFEKFWHGSHFTVHYKRWKACHGAWWAMESFPWSWKVCNVPWIMARPPWLFCTMVNLPWLRSLDAYLFCTYPRTCLSFYDGCCISSSSHFKPECLAHFTDCKSNYFLPRYYCFLSKVFGPITAWYDASAEQKKVFFGFQKKLFYELFIVSLSFCFLTPFS